MNLSQQLQLQMGHILLSEITPPLKGVFLKKKHSALYNLNCYKVLLAKYNFNKQHIFPKYLGTFNKGCNYKIYI